MFRKLKKYLQVDFARANFEKEVKVGEVFGQDEMIDIIGVTKGHGYKGQLSPLFPIFFPDLFLILFLSFLMMNQRSNAEPTVLSNQELFF